MPAVSRTAAAPPAPGQAAPEQAPLLPVIGFVWVEQRSLGARRIYAGGAISDNWEAASPSAVPFGLMARIMAGVPTNDPNPRRGTPGNAAQQAALGAYLAQLQPLLPWLRTIGNTVTGPGGRPATREDILAAAMRLRPDQVIIGIAPALEQLEGGTYYVVDRAALPAGVLAALQGAQQVARSIVG